MQPVGYVAATPPSTGAIGRESERGGDLTGNVGHGFNPWFQQGSSEVRKVGKRYEELSLTRTS